MALSMRDIEELTMRIQFGKTIVKLAAKDERIVLITGDVVQEMDEFREKWPERWWNLGIAEQSIIGVAAGLAIGGMRPVVYSLTPFVLERPFEAVKIDIDEQNLPVMLIGYDSYYTHGPTHRPLDFEATARLFKNIAWFSPRSEKEAGKDIVSAYLRGGPSLIHLQAVGMPPGWD